MKKFLPFTFFYVLFTTYYVLFPSSAFAFSDTTYFIHQDHLGSVIAVTDETGNVVSQTKYSPYGSLAMEQWNNGTIGVAPITERDYTGQIADTSTAGCSTTTPATTIR